MADFSSRRRSLLAVSDRHAVRSTSVIERNLCMPRLITLGGLSAQNGTLVNGVANPRSRLAILAVLAVAGDRGIRREKLAAMFWPDSDEERARSALRQALFTLKRDIGAGEITIGGVDLRLNTEVLSADVTEFESALRDSRYEDAASLYRGPFLDGVFLRESPEFERWADEQRTRLSAEFGRALEKAAAAAAAQGDARAAAMWWERRALHDPLSGRVARLYMEALVAAGDREEAIRYANSHAQLVKKELEADPDAELMAFADKLREEPTRQADIILSHIAPDDHVAGEVVSVEKGQLPSRAESSADSKLVPGRRGTAGTPGRSRRLISAVGALAFAIGVWMTVPKLLGPTPTTVHRVLVAPFENRTGDSTLKDLGVVLADWLSQTLQRTGFVEVVDPVSTLRVARASEGAEISLAGHDRAAAIARSADARIVIWGDIRLDGDSLVYRTAISDVADRTLLKSANAVSSPRAEPLQAGNGLTDAVAGALASALDRRLASISSLSSRPPSFIAYREFIRGLDVFPRPMGDELSIPHFTAAARLDTAFAQPLIWLGFAYGNTRRNAERDSIIHVLIRRRDRLDPLEQHALDWFEADRKNYARGKYEAARAAALLSPGSPWSHNTGNMLLGSLQPDEALRYIRQVNPEHGWVGSWFPYWKNLTVALHLTEQHEEELKASRRAQATDPDEQNFVYLEIRALIGHGNVQMAMRRIDELLRMPPSNNSPGLLLSTIAQEMRAHGHPRLADSLTDRALAWFATPAARRYATLAVSGGEGQLAGQVVRALYEAGRWKEASDSYQHLAASFPEAASALKPLWSLSAPLFDARGAQQLAKRRLEDFDAAVKPAAHSRPELLDVARVAAALGQRERALRYLAEYIGCCAGPDLPSWLHRDWEWWSMRNDPQFRALWGRRGP